VTLSADLEAGFTADGFDLAAAFGDLGDVLGAVGLPSLDIDISVSLAVDGLGTDRIAGALASLTGGLDTIVGGLPDLESLLGPLQAAIRLPELVAELDVTTLLADLSAAIAPAGPGLVPLVAAASSIGDVPLVGSLGDLVGAVGLDVRAPGAMLGGAAGGLVSLAQLLGALLTVEAVSRTIDERAALTVDLLSAERLAGLIARIGASGGARLADLLTGIDPNDAVIVDLVARPVEAYVGLVAELSDSLVRGLAFAEATVVDTDFAALVVTLAVASAALTEAALPPVRALVESAAALVAPALAVTVPGGGVDVLLDAVADIRTSIEAVIDGLPADAIAAIVQQAIDPVLLPVRTVRQALEELAAVIGVVFEPLEQVLAAVDLDPVRVAIDTVVEPVASAVAAITSAIGGAQGAIEAVVGDVHDVLTPLRTTLTDTAGALTEPFADAAGVITALDLAALQESVRSTLDGVTAAIAAAPVEPVFDVASGIIGTAADALGLVPKALLPDDLRHELEAACAPVEALDLEPTRVELHDQLTAMIASIDASALDAVAEGYAAVQAFVASIDPRPHVEALETDAFTELTARLDALDPESILEPVLEALDAAQEAIAGIDLAALLAPVDTALDEVAAAIDGIDPTDLLEPVATALDGATSTVRNALRLDELATTLTEIDNAVAAAVERLPVTELLDATSAAWTDLVAQLRGADQDVGGGVLRGLLGGLLPGVSIGGLPEVVAWIRGERDGAVVVRERLTRAADRLAAAASTIGAIDVTALTADLDGAHRAITAAITAHPLDSALGERLGGTVSATNPAADLGRIVLNVGRVKAAFAAAGASVAATTAPDRSEVRLTAAGLATACGPLAPIGAKVGELAAFVGVDVAVLTGPSGLRGALAGLAEQLGPDPILGTLRAVLTRLSERIVDFVHDGVVAPLQSAVGELTGLLDLLTIEALTADLTAIRERLVAVVVGLRPSTVLAEPLAAFEGLRTTLSTFDPLGPVRVVVDAMKAEITAFATDLAPTTLLAPVLDLYDELAAAVGAFDVAGLLEPVLAALHEIARIIDRGIDEVIDALGKLKTACESEGGAIPGLDLSVAASVDVGGALGL